MVHSTLASSTLALSALIHQSTIVPSSPIRNKRQNAALVVPCEREMMAEDGKGPMNLPKCLVPRVE